MLHTIHIIVYQVPICKALCRLPSFKNDIRFFLFRSIKQKPSRDRAMGKKRKSVFPLPGLPGSFST